MEQQALQIATWGENVYVKIPITDTRGRSSRSLVKRLAQQGVKVNVTALMTLDQVDDVLPSLATAHRVAFRYSPAASPMPVAIRFPSCAGRWRACAPIRKSS